MRGKDDGSGVEDQDEQTDEANKEASDELVERDSENMSGGDGNGVPNDSRLGEV